jgi:hypothetical protein
MGKKDGEKREKAKDVQLGTIERGALCGFSWGSIRL